MDDQATAQVRHLTVTGGTAPAPPAPGDPSVTVLVVTTGTPEPGQAEVAALSVALADPRLIAVGWATGRVTWAAAAVALACDLVVSAPDANWAEAADVIASAACRRLPAARAGLLPAAGASITGADLHRAGLVTDLAEDPADAAQELAVELAAAPSGSLSGSKEMLDAALGEDLDVSLEREANLQIAAMTGPEHLRIVAEQLPARPRPKSAPQT